MDVSIPLPTDLPTNMDSTQTKNEESLQLSRKRKLDELDDVTMKQNDPTKFHYDTISDDDLKHRLVNVLKNETHHWHSVNRWLSADPTLLVFVRKHACLLAKYILFEMQLELYQNFLNMTESMLPWLSTMSEAILRRMYMYERFITIHESINKKRPNIEIEFNAVHDHLAKSISDQQQVSSSSSDDVVDMNILTSAILMFVRQDQQKWDALFQQKRDILMLLAKDVRLLYEFYHLQTNNEEIDSAERMWEKTMNELQKNKLLLLLQESLRGGKDSKNTTVLVTNKNKDKINDSSSFNQAKLRADLLMNIIESRQKILKQRLEFDHHIDQILSHDEFPNQDHAAGEK